MSGHPQRPPGAWESWALAAVCGMVLLIVLAVWGAGSLGDTITGHPVQPNPFGYVAELALGERAWPGTPATLALAGLGLLLLGVTVAAVVLVRRRRRRPESERRIAQAARLLAHPKDLPALSPAGVAASAARLRPSSRIDPRNPAQHGRLIGRTVVGDMPVRASHEDLGVHIWGPRTGKTTALTIPMLVEADGPAIATTNRRDLPDATRGPRRRRGHDFVFDLQQVAGEPQRFWYNPFRRIESISDAEVVAGHFVAGTRDADAKTDAYFDGSAESLLAACLLAAARDGGTLIDVYRWLGDASDDTPFRILERSGDDLVAVEVRSVLQAPEKQQAGVYDTALKLLRCLRNPDVLRWVTPPRSGGIPEFDPARFVTSTDTLYLLSNEGPGSAAPLVATLTEHVCHAAVRAAATRPLGRIDPPLTSILDEAANVCRWRDLPNLYSHFGGRGIVVETILQSWNQGVEAWGHGGMAKLWGAANVRTYGGGSADADWLRKMAEIAGEYDMHKISVSTDHSGRRSRSFQPTPKQKLPVDLLAAMPKGRALVLASGAPAFLAKTVPWWQGQHAEAIRTSLAEHDPGSTSTPAAAPAA
ncbi:type IV secretory system conjugative DNA transfer family protein [Prauserella muralis]|uniref:TraD/TraG TraM recognition site domain-containing protein n=1 Tax=Prauserella muralis TaxID=588067 RepID=A0A2V4ABY4_9PSEU|nr:type IV secretory system conjugative DNA transfer family protein [Prauserella muralis]PXY16609.1 hypothetical protein BAY60_36065 [Prauserella muralis]TWE11143.1 TraM-binding TraD/TraG-like protein [Prauserella muralis]